MATRALDEVIAKNRLEYFASRGLSRLGQTRTMEVPVLLATSV